MTYQDCSVATTVPSFSFLPTFISTGTSTVTATNGDTWSVATDRSVNTAFAFPVIGDVAQNANAAGTCTCTNVPKEFHYTAITTGGNQISSVTLNTVFEASVVGTCTDALEFEQIYSFTFKESANSRVQSGSPGYKKGFPILAGTEVTNNNLTSILAKEQGFQLYGANEDGD